MSSQGLRAHQAVQAFSQTDKGDQLCGLLGGNHSHLLEPWPSTTAKFKARWASVLRVLVPPQDCLHLFRLHSDPPDLDLAVNATDDLQLSGPPSAHVPGAIEPAEVLGLNPLLVRQLLVFPVARRQHTTKANLACLPTRHWHQKWRSRLLGFFPHHEDFGMRLRSSAWSLGREKVKVNAFFGHRVHCAGALGSPVEVVKLRLNASGLHYTIGDCAS
mmetsp:Transcript_11024/g.20760  ORF Transcript_11024/g.20760 Transcript_11024/m.20760 type:complete len:216 (+) Transcript_11024:1640-2287(+)